MQEALRRPVSKDRTNQPLSENWFEKRQQSENNSGPKRLVSGSFQHPRGSTSLQVDAARKGPIPEQTGKPLKQISEPFPHNKRNRSTSDRSKKGYNANRPAPKSVERPKSEVTKSSTFEVKSSDFPELGDITSNKTKHLFSQEPQLCWGSIKSPLLQSSPTAANKDAAGNNGLKPKSTQQVPLIKKSESPLTARPGQEIGLVLPNPHGSPAASWANIASQPPKVIQKISTVCGASSQEDTHQPTQQNTKKKKKKKKKQSNSVSESQEEEADHKQLQQAPPKFEDEEEFPDLSSASGNLNKGPKQTANSVIQESTWITERDGSAVQVENLHKSKITNEKPVSTASKKGQASQKKSKVPVQLDLGNMLTVLEQKQQSQKSKNDVKPLTLSVGGALPVVHKEPAVQKKHPWKQERVAHNPLDSTSPLVKKGKQREVPKAKKPSPLKRIILKEREERKQNRLLEERDPARMTDEVSQVESPTSENPSEITSEQATHEPSSDQSWIEEGDQMSSEVNEPNNSAEETTPSTNCNPVPNPSLPKIHSRKFRDYCSQILSKDVDECVTTLLKELVRFQDRLYQKDPMKARMKRRLVMGLREVLKHLKLRKVKCVIISPNCERVQSKGGLDDALHTIIDTCREQGVPFVFALSRKSLGRCVSKAVPVSLVGIFNYDGAQDHYHKMIELTSQARQAYEVMVTNLEANSHEQQEVENENEQETEPQAEPLAVEEPEYIKIWKKMLEKDYNHKVLPLEEQFSSMAFSPDSDKLLNDHEGS
ncbi:selenocysteine insertion sequence-binding protein 2-like [Trichomycterus rosablanca]|uniref:selenocysteine insertion sequence-binding protein 2-like n=1 Tax=Trichomycterus rosablanca TaxID=2290929 RepID=UPI002F358CB6